MTIGFDAKLVINLPETTTASLPTPENGWWELVLSFWEAPFFSGYLSFREGIFKTNLFIG